MELLQAFLTVTVVHLLAAASPGPDFVMVSQQSLVHGDAPDSCAVWALRWGCRCISSIRPLAWRH